MHTKIKFLISLFFILIVFNYSQESFAKYVIEDINTVAKLNIDRCKPNIELISISSSNTNYENYANKTHTLTARIKIIEKNIITNNFSQDKIQIYVNNNLINPTFKSFSLLSENPSEKTYEFSFTNVTGNGNLQISIPEGIIEDRSGLINDPKIFPTTITIDNTPPIGTFQETASSNNNSKAIITANENIRPIEGWNLDNNSKKLSKEFQNYITYELPITDFAQNTSKVLIDIKNATNIILEYSTYDDYQQYKVASGGQISAPDTISSNSICTSETIIFRLDGNIDASSLQGRIFLYTHWGQNSKGICYHSELPYYYGYNPKTNNTWFDITSNNSTRYNKELFTQLGGIGLNVANKTDSSRKNPIPENIASQYLYGVSGMQFRLKNNSNLSVVYQAYIKKIGWIPVSCNGEECFYQHDKPFSAIRINIVPNSEKQYLIDYWNKDVNTNNIK